MRNTASQMILDAKLANEAETAKLAARLAGQLQVGDLIALRGDLGAGKTSFARALIRARVGDDALDVPSPTFTLLQTYEADTPIAHFDLYRVEHPDELHELGWDDALEDSITLVEWPDHAGDLLPQRRLDVTLQIAESEGARHIRIERLGDDDAHWSGRLNEL